MKVIIAGGRDFNYYETAEAHCDYILQNQKDVEIVSGRCSVGVHTFTAEDGTKVYGADGIGELYAKNRGYKVMPFPADWSLGKSGGAIRNRAMVAYSDALIAFYDGRSKGTRNVIYFAKEKGIKFSVKLFFNQ